MLRLRALVPAGEKASAEEAICDRLAGEARRRGAKSIAVYIAVREELDLSRFIRAAQPLPSRPVFAAPRWDGSRYRLARLECTGGGIDASTLATGPMGIPEPRADAPEIPPGKIDFWVVPGLAFAPDGARLGYGGGWYDRLLTEAADDAPVFAPAYAFQILPSLPAEETDACRVSAVAAQAGAC